MINIRAFFFLGLFIYALLLPSLAYLTGMISSEDDIELIELVEIEDSMNTETEGEGTDSKDKDDRPVIEELYNINHPGGFIPQAHLIEYDPALSRNRLNITIDIITAPPELVNQAT